MFKKILAMALCVLVLAGSTVAALAQPTPRYQNVSSARVSLSIRSGKAKITGSVNGNSNVTSISTTVSLQMYDGGSWTEVDSWSDSISDSTISISETSGTLEKGKYRAVLKFTARASGKSESGSKTSSAATY